MTEHQALESTDIAAIILAGGLSSRMGSDKALLPFGDEMLLERLIRVVNPLTDQIVVMLSQMLELPEAFQQKQPTVMIGRDREKEQGPMQGIADALEFLPDSIQYAFVLSCDLPFLTTEWLEFMLRSLKQSARIDVVCAKQDAYLNPLIAVYRKPILQQANTLLHQGQRSCLALMDSCAVLPLVPTPQQAYKLSNINTPEEYQWALEHLEP